MCRLAELANTKKMVDEAPCDKCIDKTDLALHKPADETEFSNYERGDEE